MLGGASVTAGQSSALTERPKRIKEQSRPKRESRQIQISQVGRPADVGWTRDPKRRRDLEPKARGSDIGVLGDVRGFDIRDRVRGKEPEMMESPVEMICWRGRMQIPQGRAP